MDQMNQLEQIGIDGIPPASNGHGAPNGQSGNGAGPAPRVFVRDLEDGQRVVAAFVVRGRERRQKKDGGEWLQLMLADRTGRVPGKMWEEIDQAFDACAPGSIVMVDGRFGVHERYGTSITIRAVRSA